MRKSAGLTAAVLAGYLVGSLPTGVVLGRLVAGVDVRRYGSRGTGATNVLRAVGPAAAAGTFMVDSVKGYLAVRVGDRLGGDPGGLAAGIAAGLGHSWPVFAQFRGGRSVLTCWGSLMAMDHRAAWAGAVAGASTVAATHYVSAGALFGVAVSAGTTWAEPGTAPRARRFALFAVVLLTFRLRSNIGRLARGEERRLGSEVNLAKAAAQAVGES